MASFFNKFLSGISVLNNLKLATNKPKSFICYPSCISSSFKHLDNHTMSTYATSTFIIEVLYLVT